MIEDEWGLHRYNKMHDHWKEFGPPVHIAVGAYLGYGQKKTGGNLNELAAMFASNGGVIN